MTETVLNSMNSMPLAKGGSFWFPPQASDVAAGHDFTYDLILWVCIVFFVLICGATLYFMVKYRKRPGHKEQITSTHNTRLEIAWSVIPLALLMVFFGVSTYWYFRMVTPPGEECTEIRVEASQWKWRFNYEGQPFDKAWQTKKLYLVKDQPYQLVMTTPDSDVIHSLFIPAFRVKQDCVPGRFNKLWFRPTKTGEFPLYCTEYCGKDHSNMTTTVVVVESEAEWQRLVESEYNPADYDYDELGQIIFDDNCKTCHSLQEDVTIIGPSFAGFGDRWGKDREMADGSKRKVDRNYIKDSLENPGQEVVAGYPDQMTPFMDFNEREFEAIVRFLKKQ